MLTLLMFSVASWSIVFMKYRLFRKVKFDSEDFLGDFLVPPQFEVLLTNPPRIMSTALKPRFLPVIVNCRKSTKCVIVKKGTIRPTH